MDRLDGGTKELRRKVKAVGALHMGHSDDNRPRAQNLAQGPLDYYGLRGWITGRQHDAGAEFYTLWYYGAEKSAYVLSRFGAAPAGRADYESRAGMERKYNAARRAIRSPLHAQVCFNVCCVGEWAFRLKAGEMDGSKLSRKTGMKKLKEALDDLADHFRLPLPKA